MNMKNLIYLTLTFLMLVTACKDDDPEKNLKEEEKEEEISTTVTIAGMVLDKYYYDWSKPSFYSNKCGNRYIAFDLSRKGRVYNWIFRESEMIGDTLKLTGFYVDNAVPHDYTLEFKVPTTKNYLDLESDSPFPRVENKGKENETRSMYFLEWIKIHKKADTLFVSEYSGNMTIAVATGLITEIKPTLGTNSVISERKYYKENVVCPY